MGEWLKMFFKKKKEKKEKKIFFVKYLDVHDIELSQNILAHNKQRAVICLCERVVVKEIISIEELKYE